MCATVVREMAPGDRATVTALCGQLGYPATAEQVARRSAAIEREGAGALFVAEAEGRVIGWVYVRGVLLMEADPYAEIWGLVVDLERRGQGVGGALLRRAEEWAATQGYATVGLRSNVSRAEAHGFYQGQGYKIVKTSYTFWKTLEG